MTTMTILKGLLFFVEAVCCLLLIGIILIQKTKGGGLGMAFGGGMSESLFGSRAGNVLTKATIILAMVFMINTVALAILFARSHEQSLMDRAAPPPAPAPMQGAAPASTPMPMTPAPSSQTGDLPAPVAPPVGAPEAPVAEPTAP